MLTATFAFLALEVPLMSPPAATALSTPVCAAPPVWPLVCGLAFALLAVVASTIWALLERRERTAIRSQNEQLSLACRSITEHHYRERVQAEERHLLAHDSSLRNVLEHLERTLLGKPKP